MSLALILVAFAQQPCARCTDASQKRSVCVLSIVRTQKHRGTAFWSPDLSRQKVAEASGAGVHQLQEDSCGP